MKITVLEQSKNKLVFRISGESHTLCNALKDVLRTDANVNSTSYFITHPDIDEPTFIIETKAKSTPKKVLQDAVQKLVKQNNDFLKAFQKEIK